jgi:hypothetical protein
MAERPRKVVRSYRLVFRRRWRLFRIQGWRIPLPGGVELRLLGYWLCCVAVMAICAKLPAFGELVGVFPVSLRLLALPLATAWALSRWEVDGRPPHRALLGLASFRLRPRTIAALRRVPRSGTRLAPLGRVVGSPDLDGPSYPHGTVDGPARLLLRYPVAVSVSGRRFSLQRGRRRGAASTWRIWAHGDAALHAGRTLEVPPGKRVRFERGEL